MYEKAYWLLCPTQGLYAVYAVPTPSNTHMVYKGLYSLGPRHLHDHPI